MKELFQPYKSDIKLLKKLSLPIWGSILNEEFYIREVFPYYKENGKTISIKIYVTCMPTQFYRFIVHNKEEDIFCQIETGSGSLTKYYPMVLAVAEGNLRVRSIFN